MLVTNISGNQPSSNEFGYCVTTYQRSAAELTSTMEELEVKNVDSIQDGLKYLREDWDLPIENDLVSLIVNTIENSDDRSWVSHFNSKSVGLQLVHYTHKISAKIN